MNYEASVDSKQLEPSVKESAELVFESYLNKISLNNVETIQNLATQLDANGNTTFKQGFDLQVAGVPVAEDHTRFIGRSLECLAIQAEHAISVPAVVLSLNYPGPIYWETGPQVEENIKIVKRFQESHPNIPLSYFVTNYCEDEPIGEIRDHIFGAAAMLHKTRSEANNQPMTDLIFTNWDVDTGSATPRYFVHTQQSYLDNIQSTWTAYPNIRHSRLDSKLFPNANRLLAWYDLVAQASKSSMPAHFSTNLVSWAKAQGYGKEDLGEHGKLCRRLEGWDRKNEVPHNYLGSSIARVSPHRLVGMMATQEERVEYDRLIVTDRVDVEPLDKDISAGYLNRQLEGFTKETFSGAYWRRHSELKKAGVDSEQAANDATLYAARYVRVGAAVISAVKFSL